MTYELLDSTIVTADAETPLAPTTANQTLATILIPENHFKHILVHIELEIAMVTTPVVQEIDLELINDSTVIKTFNFSPATTTSLGIWPYSIEFPVAKNNEGEIILQLGNAATADPDTSFKVKGIWCAGVG